MDAVVREMVVADATRAEPARQSVGVDEVRIERTQAASLALLAARVRAEREAASRAAGRAS